MNTHVNLVVILGLIFIGLGTIFTFFSGANIYREVSDYYDFDSNDVLVDWNRLNDVDSVIWIFFLFGLLFFVFGIGLLLKAKWTQRANNLLMTGAFLGWTYCVMKFFQDTRRTDDFFIVVGVTVVGYVTLTSMSLFLRNEKVLTAYTTDFEEYKNDDILDA